MATKKADKKTPPTIRARRRGSTTDILKTVADQYLEKNPDREIRWVYAPEHDARHSQIYRRQAQGYKLVDPQNEELDFPHGITGSQVRVGDLVLMSIDKDSRSEDEQMQKEIAQREAAKSRDTYYEAQLRMGKTSPRATGDISDRSEHFEVKVEED